MVNNKKTVKASLSLIEKLYIAILLVIFGGIVLHAPISVGLGTLFPDYSLLIKSWKEILMGLAMVMLGVILYRKRRFSILKEPLMIGIIAYAGLHLLIFIITILAKGSTLSSVSSGLMIDLRYVLYFVLVYIAMRLYPTYRGVFIKVGIAGALVVVTFSLLQFFVLPVDVLKYIGYNVNNIAPYLTVDQNTDFIRINSTLRGPNSLGAYVVIVLAGLVSWYTSKKPKTKKHFLVVITLLIGGIISMWASYSRSAAVALAIATTVVLGVTTLKKLSKLWLVVSGLVVLMAIVGLFAFRSSTFVANVILHDNPTTGSIVTSNVGHIESLQDGVARMLTQPFGAGIGSTGSASLFGSYPLVIENQYLFIAHEVGWIGLILFAMILFGILNRLWALRSDWFALMVLSSGMGMVIINLVLPIWVDDTVSIVWWGLAAIAIGSKYHE